MLLKSVSLVMREDVSLPVWFAAGIIDSISEVTSGCAPR
jgi:hypothetical protein